MTDLERFREILTTKDPWKGIRVTETSVVSSDGYAVLHVSGARYVGDGRGIVLEFDSTGTLIGVGGEERDPYDY